MGHTIKRGDAPTIGWTLDPEPADGATVTVIIRERGATTPIVARAGDVDGAAVTIALTPTETAVAGEYLAELEVSPGPITYPSDGYLEVSIQRDLNP